jgi:hypothetical protein
MALPMAMSCGPKLIASVTPAYGSVVTAFSFPIVITLTAAADPSTLTVEMNGTDLTPQLTGGPTVWTVALVPGSPLLDVNDLLVKVRQSPTGTARSAHAVQFSYLPPKARVRQITSTSELITGPLGQSRIGDWLLENSVARFVVQDVAQRDLHSVGQFGGNLIDAEVVGREGRDAFFEVQPAVNVETVINAQTIEVVNDGQDGTAAILRTCGPDDLNDYINPSSQLAELGLVLPNFLAAADDRDYDVEGCTEYRLEPEKSHVAMETFITNNTPDDIVQYAGYFINGMGTLEQYNRSQSAMGLGEPLVSADTRILGYLGYDTSQGIDYGLVPIPFIGVDGEGPFQSSSFSTSGVSFMMHSQNLVFVLGGDAPAIFGVPGYGTNSFLAYFGVGDGSPANSVAMEADVKGFTTGTIHGCVTVGGAPAPGARVAVGPLSGSPLRIGNLASHFVTDTAGCYSSLISAGTYGVAASLDGVPYQGGGLTPVYNSAVVPAAGSVEMNIALPASGRVHVDVTDENGDPLPARISVVGAITDFRFSTSNYPITNSDPSPDPVFRLSVQSNGDTNTGMFYDRTDRLLPGYASLAYAGADGVAEFDLEPGSYQVVVSRGDEYSVHKELITTVAGSTTNVSAQIARVLDTAGFISSDYHVHMVNSPDSRVALTTRALSFAAEGVENVVATDHDAITDLTPTITAAGLGSFLASTIGEEVTTFDYGHFNSYPQGEDPTRVSNGATDWGGAAPAGLDFPAYGNHPLTPAQIEAAVLAKPQNAGLETVVQINHIGSHFNPLRIDTGVEPPQSFVPDPSIYRLNPAVTNFFHPFKALELWNGNNNSHQNQFTNERIGIWMNLLNQGIVSTAIADTDTHTIRNLDSAGARTWTPSSTDAPASIVDAEIGQAVKSHRAVGGQGIYVQTRLVKGASVADFSLGGNTLVTATDGSLDLEIRVQAPTWAPYDRIEIYRNAQTVSTGSVGGTPTNYTSLPTQVLSLGAAEFTRTTVNVHPSVPGAERYETNLTLPLSGLTQDEWVVVVVKGTTGNSVPTFPIYGSNVDLGTIAVPTNRTLVQLTTLDPNETGVRALGFTNALFVDVDGNAAFDPPGVQLAP